MIIIVMMVIPKLRTSELSGSSTSATKVIVKFDEVDRGRSGASGKSVKKLSKG